MYTILAVLGALRADEGVKLTPKNVEDKEDITTVLLEDTKTGPNRKFVIDGEYAKIVRKYRSLRPSNVPTQRFFLNYKKNKCTRQPIGINKFYKMPSRVAEFLKLPNAKSYTGKLTAFKSTKKS